MQVAQLLRLPQGGFQPFDIAACWGSGSLSEAISLGTFSLFGPRNLRVGPSHVAFIFEYQGRALWGESTTLCEHPCFLASQHVSGVRVQRERPRTAGQLGGPGELG